VDAYKNGSSADNAASPAGKSVLAMVQPTIPVEIHEANLPTGAFAQLLAVI